ncbi:MAG: hypothetical protein ACXVPN_15360 [Bacteroidia bacterium]
MKKITLTTIAILAFATACKSKKSATASSSSAVTDAQVAAVQARFPDATKAELQTGYSVYTGACTRCHGTKDVTAYAEPKLLEIVDDMSKKAGISASEKQALIRFAVGVRATSK